MFDKILIISANVYEYLMFSSRFSKINFNYQILFACKYSAFLQETATSAVSLRGISDIVFYLRIKLVEMNYSQFIIVNYHNYFENSTKMVFQYFA